MDWVLIGFVIFKVTVFGTGMFFAIKSHHDRAKQKKKEAEERQFAARPNSNSSG
jgi:hypothetical protein